MDERIDILEREVSAIKTEIAQIKLTYVTREEARLFDGRLNRIEADIAVLKADVAVLKADVTQLKADVAQLKADVVQLRIEQEKIRIEMARMESRLKSWMINLAISLITVMSGIQFALYTALKH